MEAAERASLRISLSAAGLAVAIASVGSAYLWYQGELKHLQVESSHAIPLTLPANSHLSDVWFSPSDRLFATFETDNKYLNLASWDLEGRTKDPVQTVKFTSGAIQESPELIMNSFHGGIPENSDVAPERALAYAISDDGSIIAWTWKSQLFIGPIGNFNKIKAIPISSPSNTAVAIIRSHLAILVNTAASVSIWDAGKGQEIFGSPITKGTTIVWGRGNTRILSSLGVARTYRLDT